jgi:hypothetical protein
MVATRPVDLSKVAEGLVTLVRTTVTAFGGGIP